MNKKIFNRERFSTGFTLMEALVYVVILSVIMAILSIFLVWLIQSTNKLKTMREALYNARRPIEIITHEIKEANDIAPSSTATYLSLEKEDGIYVDFYLATSTLYQKKGLEDPIALTSERVEVKNLEFKQVISGTTTPSVRISFIIDYKKPANRPEYQSSVNVISTVSLRNY